MCSQYIVHHSCTSGKLCLSQFKLKTTCKIMMSSVTTLSLFLPVFNYALENRYCTICIASNTGFVSDPCLLMGLYSVLIVAISTFKSYKTLIIILRIVRESGSTLQLLTFLRNICTSLPHLRFKRSRNQSMVQNLVELRGLCFLLLFNFI